MLKKKQVETAVRKLFPNAKLVSFSKFKKAMINVSYSIKIRNPDKKLVLRVYPKDDWKAKKEAYLYNLISKKAGVKCPEVFLVDSSKKIIAKTYSLLSHIEGEELGYVFKKTKNKRLAKEAGEILAKIHSIKFPYFGWIMEKEINPKFSSWADFISYDMDEKLTKISKIKSVPKKLISKAIDYFIKNKYLLKIRDPPCLLHKDYHFSHILVDKDKISGVIDMEWAIAGHNELDLIKSKWWMFEAMPEIEKPFIEGYKRYGRISKKFEKREKLYEMILAIGLVGLSYEVGNKKWFNYNLKRLEGILK